LSFCQSYIHSTSVYGAPTVLGSVLGYRWNQEKQRGSCNGAMSAGMGKDQIMQDPTGMAPTSIRAGSNGTLKGAWGLSGRGGGKTLWANEQCVWKAEHQDFRGLLRMWVQWDKVRLDR
jgi:hypothetical protein